MKLREKDEKREEKGGLEIRAEKDFKFERAERKVGWRQVQTGLSLSKGLMGAGRAQRISQEEPSAHVTDEKIVIEKSAEVIL